MLPIGDDEDLFGMSDDAYIERRRPVRYANFSEPILSALADSFTTEAKINTDQQTTFSSVICLTIECTYHRYLVMLDYIRGKKAPKDGQHHYRIKHARNSLCPGDK